MGKHKCITVGIV